MGPCLAFLTDGVLGCWGCDWAPDGGVRFSSCPSHCPAVPTLDPGDGPICYNKQRPRAVWERHSPWKSRAQQSRQLVSQHEKGLCSHRTVHVLWV